MKPFETQKLTFSEVFSDSRFFVVPAYQRRYAWTNDEIEDLIGDLMSASKQEGYFLGLIILHGQGNECFNIVDGQQRFITLSILCSCIRDALEDSDFKDSMQNRIVQAKDKALGIQERSRVSPKESHLFSSIVTERDGSRKEFKIENMSDTEERYVAACNLFHRKLIDLSQSELEALATFVLTQCNFVILTAHTLQEALRLFSITNDRGRQLRRVDILKTENLSESLVPDPSTRQSLALKWEQFEDELGDEYFEQFFYVVRLVYIKGKPQRDLLREFEERIFNKSLIGRGEAFFNRVFELIKIYRSLFVDYDYYSKENEKHFHAFNALLYILNNNANSYEWRAALLLYADKFGNKGIFEFLLKLETLVLEHWVSAVRKDERFDVFGRLLSAVEGSAKPEQAAAVVKAKKAPIIAAIKGQDLYKPSYGKYMLLRLELLSSEFDQARMISAKSVEHVLPQKPERGSDWLNWFKLNEIEDHVHKIGNLVLLSKSKNSAAKNFSFDKKKESYLKDRVSDYPRSVEVLKESAWTKSIVKARSADAAKKILADPRP